MRAPVRSISRGEVIARLREQTPACGPPRDALVAGGTFDISDGLVPASRHAGVFATRIRTAARRGHTVGGLAASVDILRQAGDEHVLPELRSDKGAGLRRRTPAPAHCVDSRASAQ